eukprot:jgi/Bigna1/67615/fgenesh1_pg.4_\
MCNFDERLSSCGTPQCHQMKLSLSDKSVVSSLSRKCVPFWKYDIKFDGTVERLVRRPLLLVSGQQMGEAGGKNEAHNGSGNAVSDKPLPRKYVKNQSRLLTKVEKPSDASATSSLNESSISDSLERLQQLPPPAQQAHSQQQHHHQQRQQQQQQQQQRTYRLKERRSSRKISTPKNGGGSPATANNTPSTYMSLSSSWSSLSSSPSATPINRGNRSYSEQKKSTKTHKGRKKGSSSHGRTGSRFPSFGMSSFLSKAAGGDRKSHDELQASPITYHGGEVTISNETNGNRSKSFLLHRSRATSVSNETSIRSKDDQRRRRSLPSSSIKNERIGRRSRRGRRRNFVVVTCPLLTRVLTGNHVKLEHFPKKDDLLLLLLLGINALPPVSAARRFKAPECASEPTRPQEAAKEFMRDNRKFILKRQAEMKYLSSVAERVCNSLQANTKITASRTTSKAKTKESKANGGGHIASSSANISSSAIIGVRAAANESDLREINANRNKHIEKIRLAVKRGDLTSLQLNALNIRHQIQDQLMSSLQVGRKDGDDEKCSGGARGGWDRQRRLISDHECKAALRSLKLQNLSSFPIIVVVHRVSMRTTRAARHEEQQQQSSTSFPKNSSTTLLKNCSCKVSLKGHNREDLIAAGQGGGSDMAALKHSSSQRTKPIKERTDLLEWNEPIRLTSARYQVHTQLETYKMKTRIQPTPYVMHLSVLVDPAILDQALDLRRGRSRSGVI